MKTVDVLPNFVKRDKSFLIGVKPILKRLWLSF